MTNFVCICQLGVLGWCAEFSELIDNLKQLGFNGNMFISTREQALKTCSEILRLPLDIKMQIIVMYLSSQVARLRRFLDADATYDDYPEIDFPVDVFTRAENLIAFTAQYLVTPRRVLLPTSWALTVLFISCGDRSVGIHRPPLGPFLDAIAACSSTLRCFKLLADELGPAPDGPPVRFPSP